MSFKVSLLKDERNTRVWRVSHVALFFVTLRAPYVAEGKYKDVSCFTMVDDNSIGGAGLLNTRSPHVRLRRVRFLRTVCSNKKNNSAAESTFSPGCSLEQKT